MPESLVEARRRRFPLYGGRQRTEKKFFQATLHSKVGAKLVLCALAMCQSVPGPAFAASLFDGVHIPDPTLRRVLEGKLRTYSGDPITEEELATISSVSLTPAGNDRVVDLTGLEFCHNLRSVDIVGHRVSDLTPLAKLPRLDKINFHNNHITDLAPLANLATLRSVVLSDNQITDVSPLAGLEGLHTLQLSGNAIVDLTPLANLHRLESLRLSRNSITDIAPLTRLTALKWLYLDHNDIRRLTSLANLKNLVLLNLSDNRIHDLAPLDIAERRFGWLYLNGNELTDISPLAELDDRVLKELGLARNRIQDVTPLGNLSEIEDELFLEHNDIIDISPLANLRLPFLHLDDNRIADVSPLAAVQGLRGVYLNNNSISDISPLALNTSLDRFVDLRHNPLDEATDTSTSALTTLEANGVTVFLEDDHGDTWGTASDMGFEVGVTGEINYPTSHDVDVFRLEPEEMTFATISESLSIVGIRVFSDSGDLVGECRPVFGCEVQLRLEPRVHYVEIWTTHYSGNYEIRARHHVIREIPDANLRYAIERYHKKPFGQAITSIEMDELYGLHSPSSNITDLTGLEFASNLDSVDLSDNRISDISPLRGLTQLEKLNLSQNILTDISALGAMQDLEQVDLADNEISDISPLANKANLRTLTLDRNAISTIAPLVNLNRLDTLSVQDNVIANLSGLPKFDDLQTLMLSGNAISDLTPLNRSRLPFLLRLDVDRNAIRDVGPLTSMTWTTWVNLSKNRIADLSPLRDAMLSLTALELADNELVDIEPLKSLTDLSYLVLAGNRIQDISALEPWPPKLRTLQLQRNAITDIGPLARNEEFPNATDIDLRHNRILGQDDLLAVIASRRVVLHFDDDHVDALDAAATPLGIGGQQPGVIDPWYDVDVFELKTGGGLNIAMYTTGGVDTHGWLYDDSGRELAYDTDDGERNNMLIERRLDAGTYRIVVAGHHRSVHWKPEGSYVLNAGVRIREERTLTVSWEDQGDSSTIGYEVLATPVDGSESRRCTAFPGATSCVLANLVRGTVYQIAVYRMTSGGLEQKIDNFGVSQGVATEPEETLRTFWRGWRLFLLGKDAE